MIDTAPSAPFSSILKDDNQTVKSLYPSGKNTCADDVIIMNSFEFYNASGVSYAQIKNESTGEVVHKGEESSVNSDYYSQHQAIQEALENGVGLPLPPERPQPSSSIPRIQEPDEEKDFIQEYKEAEEKLAEQLQER